VCIGGADLESSDSDFPRRLQAHTGMQDGQAFTGCIPTFAVIHLLQDFLIGGGDVFTLKQILGHSTLKMVRHYVNLA
jgi:hypothetical protein